MRIFLLGFMGCGKSYSGQRLAEKFNMDFIDLDEYIEKKERRTIREIFEKDGEAFFRKIEKDCLKEMEQSQMTIISVGGGTPCFFDNMDWMNAKGITIFLETPLDLLSDRLKKAMANRPLLKNFSQNELKIFIEKKLEERNPFYQKSQIVYKQMEEGMNVGKDLGEVLFREK